MGCSRYRPTYYQCTCLNDGTVLSAVPIRKPHPEQIKRRKTRIDVDNIFEMWRTAGMEFAKADEGRLRFFDLITNSLNTRRNLRALVLPRLAAMEKQMADLMAAMARIDERLSR